jgi:hypothetical protein
MEKISRCLIEVQGSIMQTLEAGRELIALKARCAPGTWEEELRRRFLMTLRTAQKYMVLARWAEDLPADEVARMRTAVGFILARQSSPPEATAIVLDMVKRGETVSEQLALDIVGRLRVAAA